MKYSINGREPIVYRRNELANGEAYAELAEDFRLFLNLYETVEDVSERSCHWLDVSGDKEEVTIITENTVAVGAKYLREYPSVPHMGLLLYFEYTRFSHIPLSDMGPQAIDVVTHDDGFICLSGLYMLWR